MKFKEIEELIKLIDETKIAEFKIEQGDFKLSIRTKEFAESKKAAQIVQAPVQHFVQPQQQAPVQQTPPPVASNNNNSNNNGAAEDDTSHLLTVKSPMIGTFYRCPSPEKPSYVKVGDSIVAGNVVCIVEAMKLFNEIETEVSGKIVKVLVEDASPVEYDQPLFLVDPNG